ncbi:hypothetical protein [Flavobacterium psychrophilum]|uniref:Uncharacterized protein n=1 Tax=Flavobacterium psychrophilum (strain ATCC 49511 / DSM 21280 / CIP 103535 / JIP02/86) TaxID=402612 RepID=A6GXQ6_FLAPJ|nr:hypothetical protein [Flavobacterium psychrophilum]QCW20015.1 hypothetical protein [Flavobacterium phage FPSV-D15]QCW20795.1 hypothetical protein [Flavobacterium phage FPSV-D35]AIT65688.1 hypothetical protein IB65_07365 [Flavobacterium psychrophilum]AKC23696.1 hypothetical protein IY38_03990 [Flavobacterium psychrophilum]EKT4549108.1 hypothetical protein [Flavobacterium psychrophilum]
MNPIYHGDKDTKSFYEEIEKLTDRELQERQAFYLRTIARSNHSIKLNLQFWYYFAIAIGAIAFIVMANK